MDFLWHYLVAGGLFLAIDSLWIGVVANKFYKDQLGDLMADKPKLLPAAIFYLVYMAAITVFVVDPALNEDSLSYALGRGALLGLAMYCTYDLTNKATLRKWPTTMTIVDIIWGTLITTIVSALVFLIFN